MLYFQIPSNQYTYWYIHDHGVCFWRRIIWLHRQAWKGIFKNNVVGIQAGPEENRPSPLVLSVANFKVWSTFRLGPIRDYPVADHPVNSIPWCSIWEHMKRIWNKMRQLERLTLHRAWDSLRLSWLWPPGRCSQGNEREGVANSSPLLKHIVWHSWRVILIKPNHIRYSQKNFWINFQRLLPRSWARLPLFVVLGFVNSDWHHS